MQAAPAVSTPMGASIKIDLTCSTYVQVDVAGSCPSKYHVENKGWYSTTVKRSKDLLACTDRHDLHTALNASPYTVKSVSASLWTHIHTAHFFVFSFNS